MARFASHARKGSEASAHYVALGSSFAAGLGLGPRAPGSPVVSQRSLNGYPQILARMLDFPSFTDMTSSGATLRNVLRGGQMFMVSQVRAIGPETSLVTLTAGGNDIGYVGDIMLTALRNRGGFMGALIGALRKSAMPVAQRDFAGLATLFRATLTEIRRRAPDARIVVVTYPAIIPEGLACPELGLTQDEADLMRAVGDRLAQVTRDAVREAGATLVDMALLSTGHEVCGPDPWVNGPKPQTGSAFHPNLAGARATAEAIARVIHES